MAESSRENCPLTNTKLAANTCNAELLYFRFVTCSVARQSKRSLCDGGNIRESPVFVVSRGKSNFAETRECTFAQISQPGQLASSSALLEFGETVQISSELFGCSNHVLYIPFMPGPRIRSLPIPSPSSGPPDRTMRPLTSTCTKSGTM